MSKICNIDGCNKPVKTMSLCGLHYQRMWKHGDPFFTKRNIYELHGMNRTPIHIVWVNMIARCERKSHPKYSRYGGRGIKICKEWRNSFIKFYKDMGDIPFLSATLDRKDNDGDYCKENCRWATVQEQTRNKGMYSNNISGVKGVKWNKSSKKWYAQININSKRIHLGGFVDFSKAVRARKVAENFYMGKN